MTPEPSAASEESELSGVSHQEYREDLLVLSFILIPTTDGKHLSAIASTLDLYESSILRSGLYERTRFLELEANRPFVIIEPNIPPRIAQQMPITTIKMTKLSIFGGLPAPFDPFELPALTKLLRLKFLLC